MAVLLGVDTGGTYTDAVAYDDATDRILGKAKALTTPLDLAAGVGEAAGAALAAAGVAPGDVALVSLSTTLATNALVEGRGDPAGLVLIGFRQGDLDRDGLGRALGGDPAILIAGGHDITGAETAPLDLEALEAAVDKAAQGVAGFAVAGLFAVRNAAHEEAARRLIARRTGLPVTCSHELSARLGGPRRALTTLLNARLIGVIRRLIDGASGRLAALGIAAPLMVVKGDGALMTAALARARPIETILSGPAASLVGAARLTGLDRAVVADIGGTTTDIAVLEGGRPRLDPEGAEVGGWRTMVRAAAMRTHGLGGDSEVSLDEAGTGEDGPLALGPARATPVALFAAGRAAVHAALDRQLAAPRPDPHDGVFVERGPRFAAPGAVEGRAAAILGQVGPEGAAADGLVSIRRDEAALAALIADGRLRRVAFTPTDAAHVLGLHGAFDRAAAEKAATLFARQRRRTGAPVAADAAALSRAVIDRLTRRSAELILDAAFAADGAGGAAPATSPLGRAALAGASGFAEARIRLAAPLVGLGAAAAAYYPAVAALAGAEAAVPGDADVANALGAVVGRVSAEAVAVVTCPEPGRFALATGAAAETFADEAAAVARAEGWARAEAARRAETAGAEAPEVTLIRVERRATIEGRDQLVELTVTARAAGRPAFARG